MFSYNCFVYALYSLTKVLLRPPNQLQKRCVFGVCLWVLSNARCVFKIEFQTLCLKFYFKFISFTTLKFSVQTPAGDDKVIVVGKSASGTKGDEIL